MYTNFGGHGLSSFGDIFNHQAQIKSILPFRLWGSTGIKKYNQIKTLRMLRSNVGVWTKWRIATMSVKIRVISLQKIRLSLAFFEEKAGSLWGRRWWFCIERGAAALEDLSVKRHAVHCITSKGRAVHCINRSALYPIYCTGGPFWSVGVTQQYVASYRATERHCIR